MKARGKLGVRVTMMYRNFFKKRSNCCFSSNFLKEDWNTGSAQEPINLESTFRCFNKVGGVP